MKYFKKLFWQIKKVVSEIFNLFENSPFNNNLLINLVFASGVIIKAPSWNQALGFDVFKEIVEQFDATTVNY
jgi:hypothetical protein